MLSGISLERAIAKDSNGIWVVLLLRWDGCLCLPPVVDGGVLFGVHRRPMFAAAVRALRGRGKRVIWRRMPVVQPTVSLLTHPPAGVRQLGVC
jgi:hypothetical protein